MAQAQGRTAAIALSALLHIAVFAWLVGQQRGFPPAFEPPAMRILLVPTADRSPPPTPPAPHASHRRPTLRPAGRALPPSVPPLVLPQAPSEREAVPAPDSLRQTLRGLFRCLPGASLDPTARERCQAQFAGPTGRDRRALAPKLNLDRTGEFAAGQNAEPYLQRRPKNGCKARAGGDVAPGPGGTPGDTGTAGGVSCAFSF